MRTVKLVMVLAVVTMTAGAVAQPQEPTSDRSMEFRPGLGDAARERVPGGRLVVMAYSAALLLIGSYVGFVARKAAKLEGDLRRLEDDLARKGADKDAS